MNTAGTYYYPPSAGTGNLLLANPPFIFHLMDTNQPTPAEGLPGLTVEEFSQLSQAAGGSGQFEACNYDHAFRIAQRAYLNAADVQLKACCDWVRDGNGLMNGFHKQADDMRADLRPKPPSLRKQALAILDDCNLDAAHENTIRRALEALPE
jgi:hypothetical protein